MPSIVDCPDCHRKLKVPEELLGQMVRCPSCNSTFTASSEIVEQVAITPPAMTPPAGYERPEPVRELEPVAEPAGANRGVPLGAGDYPPRRAPTPHRGTIILVLGICSIVFSGCLGVILGPIAWTMGNTDLAAIRAGRMGREGEGLTNAGRICGIIGTILGISLCCCGGSAGIMRFRLH